MPKGQMALKYKVVRSAIRPLLYVSGTSKPLCLVETEARKYTIIASILKGCSNSSKETILGKLSEQKVCFILRGHPVCFL